MKKTLIVAATALACLWAVPAGAQDFPDLPGMDPARNAVPARDGSGSPGTGAGSSGTERAATDVPAGSVRPAADPPQRMPASEPAAAGDDTPDLRPAAATTDRAPSRDSLPSTGAAIAGIALLGLALTAGGSLLRELVRGR